MSEYGSGMSMADMFNLDKERIKMALKGELVSGEDESGFTYAPASKEECEEYILKAFDNAVFHCLKCARSGRALEKILNELCGIKPEDYFYEYMKITSELEREDAEKYEFYFEEELETGEEGDSDD